MGLSIAKHYPIFKSKLEGNSKARVVRVTRVRIMYRIGKKPDIEKDVFMAESMAVQHVSDQDCRFKGQKAALKKVLQQPAYTGKKMYALRAHLWHKFFERTNKGKEILGLS